MRLNIEGGNVLQRLIFSDESMFHLYGKVNRLNVLILGLQHPHETIENLETRPGLMCFVFNLKERYMGHSFFAEKTVSRITYLDVLNLRLISLLTEDSADLPLNRMGSEWKTLTQCEFTSVIYRTKRK